jgi:hypothetical protein
LGDDAGVAFALDAGAVVCPGCGLSGEGVVDLGEESDGFSIGEVVDSVESGVAEQLFGLEGEDAVEGRHGCCWCWVELLMMMYIDSRWTSNIALV